MSCKAFQRCDDMAHAQTRELPWHQHQRTARCSPADHTPSLSRVSMEQVPGSCGHDRRRRLLSSFSWCRLLRRLLPSLSRPQSRSRSLSLSLSLSLLCCLSALRLLCREVRSLPALLCRDSRCLHMQNQARIIHAVLPTPRVSLPAAHLTSDTSGTQLGCPQDQRSA